MLFKAYFLGALIFGGPIESHGQRRIQNEGFLILVLAYSLWEPSYSQTA